MRNARPTFLLLLLIACSFCIGAVLEPRTSDWTRRAKSDGVLTRLLGDGRRLFANQFYVQADVYFHSGYYPGIFDAQGSAPRDSAHLKGEDAQTQGHEATAEHEHEHADGEHECEMGSFMGKPRDWVEAFGRRFIITEHTHLEQGKEREILPWLQISADLDPERVDTYTVAAYWLCNLGRVKEAEKFLRDGLRHNPDSYEILYELARLVDDKLEEPERARNLCARALKKWEEHEPGKKEPDLLTFEKIVYRLGRLEEKLGNLEQAIHHYEMAVKLSPSPSEIEQRIARLRERLAAPRSPAP